jgi:hypothetical protein
MKKSKGDAYGYERGARGVNREDNSEFMKSFDPKADRRMYGPKAVGMFATSDDPLVVENAQLEGDDA